METTSEFFMSKTISNRIKNINESLDLFDQYNSNNDRLIKLAITNGFLTPLRKANPNSKLQLNKGLPSTVYVKALLLTLSSVHDLSYDAYLEEITGFKLERIIRLITWIRNLNNEKLAISENAKDAIQLFVRFMLETIKSLTYPKETINSDGEKTLKILQSNEDKTDYSFSSSILNFEWRSFLQFIRSVPALTNYLPKPYSKLPTELKAAVIFSNEFEISHSFDGPEYFAQSYPNPEPISSVSDFEHVDRILDLKKNFADYTNMDSLTENKTNYSFGQLPPETTFAWFNNNFTEPIREKTGLLYCYNRDMKYYQMLDIVPYDPLTLWLNYEI